MGKIVAIVNWKGGTGKTTTAVNLGAALVERQYRTLIIDCDAQANATTTLLGEQSRPEQSLYHLLLSQVPPNQGLPAEGLIQTSSRLHLDLLPASQELHLADLQLAAVLRREDLLRRALGNLPARYDFVLLDCPPSLGLLTMNALAAADQVLVPVEAEPYAADGLALLMQTVYDIQAQINPDLVILGILVTNFRGGQRGPVLHRDLRAGIRGQFADLVFKQVIPQAVVTAEAQMMRQTILDYAPDSAPAQAYQAVADEILQRLGLAGSRGS